ncbi:hypothetical protein [Sinomonas sp. P10A9]|uniref:GRAM domain-containing protein n=1 Tax=Sinomonas puerhi TaxID=3238584 RepID=A0AB39KZ85_9MICC
MPHDDGKGTLLIRAIDAHLTRTWEFGAITRASSTLRVTRARIMLPKGDGFVDGIAVRASGRDRLVLTQEGAAALFEQLQRLLSRR